MRQILRRGLLAATALLLAAPVLAGELRVKIKDPAGVEVANLQVQEERVKVKYALGGAEHVLRGRHVKGKRKYAAEGRGPVAEVKPMDYGFKLRAPGGDLLWKVKLAPGKVKISDNPQGDNPFVLQEKEGGRVKLIHGGLELGKVKYYSDTGKVKVKDLDGTELYVSKSGHPSVAYGVLLLPGATPAQRYILMAEILARGR